MVVLTAMPTIPLSVGASRVVRGVRIEHICGDPRLSDPLDHELARRIVTTGLTALQTKVTGPTLFEPSSQTPAKELAHA